MASVFMKWPETSPKNYDRGILLLTLGKIQRVKEAIARDFICPGMRVLEIGCGTGTLFSTPSAASPAERAYCSARGVPSN